MPLRVRRQLAALAVAQAGAPMAALLVRLAR